MKYMHTNASCMYKIWKLKHFDAFCCSDSAFCTFHVVPFHAYIALLHHLVHRLIRQAICHVPPIKVKWLGGLVAVPGESDVGYVYCYQGLRLSSSMVVVTIGIWFQCNEWFPNSARITKCTSRTTTALHDSASLCKFPLTNRMLNCK